MREVALMEQFFLDPKDVKPRYHPQMHIVDGVLLELRLQPARAEDAKYLIDQLIKAQSHRDEITVSIRGLGLDAYVHRATAIRLPDMEGGFPYAD